MMSNRLNNIKIKRDKKKIVSHPHRVMSDAESRHGLPLSRKEIQACLP